MRQQLQGYLGQRLCQGQGGQSGPRVSTLGQNKFKDCLTYALR